jgi:hypothetical protein
MEKSSFRCHAIVWFLRTLAEYAKTSKVSRIKWRVSLGSRFRRGTIEAAHKMAHGWKQMSLAATQAPTAGAGPASRYIMREADSLNAQGLVAN